MSPPNRGPLLCPSSDKSPSVGQAQRDELEEKVEERLFVRRALLDVGLGTCHLEGGGPGLSSETQRGEVGDCG
uniref:Uncharacterized protein n=1 Tax=Knipowitschia caucasica TaxID=637954 RepID=A0AAV2MIC2_KNICA